MADSTGPNLSSAPAPTVSSANQLVRSADSRWLRLLPLYVVIFFGFVGYSLMITIFTPMILKNDTAMIAPNTSMARKTILLGVLLALYPFGQFVGSPITGSLSDRFGRKPVLLISLSITTLCYALISTALNLASFGFLALSLIVAGLAEANIVTAQSAIADVLPADQRNRFFDYIYMSVSAAYIVGPLAGGKLADPELVSWFNYATQLSGSVHQPGRSCFESALACFVLVQLFFYLAIFGFFRCYPMYLVDEFHLGVSRVSEFIAWVGVPIVLANVWLTGFLSAHMTVQTLTFWSALLTGVFMVVVVVPRPQRALWVTLFLTSGALALCLPSCATLLSVATSETDQGLVMGNNQALQVGAEALSGVLGGVVAAIMVKLSLIVLGGIAIAAALCLPFIGTPRGTE
jgi:MFS family permease